MFETIVFAVRMSQITFICKEVLLQNIPLGVKYWKNNQMLLLFSNLLEIKITQVTKGVKKSEMNE